MTIKESNDQLNAKLDYVVTRLDKFIDKQEPINNQVTINTTDIKNQKRLPIIISSIGSLLGIISILIVIIGRVFP